MNEKADFESLDRGLHIISRLTAKEITEGQDFPIRHYGILDVGNTAGLYPDSEKTILIHQTPPEIQVEPFDYSNDWKYEEVVKGAGALIRLQKALKNHEYDLVSNNCEQFVNYIKTGEKRSGQVENAVTVAAVAGAGFVGYKLLRGAGRLVGKLFKLS